MSEKEVHPRGQHGPEVSQILVLETSQQQTYDDKDEGTGWGSDVGVTADQPNQMKIIGQHNESLGSISLSHEQLMSILSNKTEGGIVTLHFQNEDGAINPVQLQIVPEEQVFQPSESQESRPGTESGTVREASNSMMADGESKITPVLQMSQPELQELLKDCKQRIKSIVFKQVEKVQEKNCITDDPSLQKLIKRKTYVDLKQNEIMLPVSNSKKTAPQYKCNRCDRGFTTAGNLKRHILNLHMEDKRSNEIKVCQYCHKTYSRQDYLTQHIKSVHERVNKYQCEHCGKFFTQKGSMTRHVTSVHLNIREYCCKHCNYQAMSYNDLKKHAANAHFNRSRYECSICGQSSWNASIIKQHVLSFHTETSKTHSRKCKYCGIVINLSKDSYPIHVAACKTMNIHGEGVAKALGKRKRSKGKGSTMCVEEEGPLIKVIPSITTEDIPWEDMCNIADDTPAGLPGTDINDRLSVKEEDPADATACKADSNKGESNNMVDSAVDSVINGYIKVLQVTNS